MDAYDGYFRSHHGYDFGEQEARRLERWFWRHWELLRPFVPERRGLRVLEIGSGVGTLVRYLPEGAVYTGLELDDDALAVARARYPGRKFEHASVEEFPMDDGSVDLVVATEVLEHLENPSLALRRISRWLAVGGCLIGSTPPPTRLAFKDPTHLTVLHPTNWARLFRRAGLDVLMLQPSTFPPLLYRVHPRLNLRLRVPLPVPGFIVTTLFAARRHGPVPTG